MFIVGQFGRAQRLVVLFNYFMCPAALLNCFMCLAALLNYFMCPAALFNYFMEPMALFNFFMRLVVLTAIFDAPFWFISLSHEKTYKISPFDCGKKIINFIIWFQECVAKFAGYEKNHEIWPSITWKKKTCEFHQ